MNEVQPVAEFAGLLADPTRSEMLLSLMDGRAFPATDLAAMAHVSPSTASYHLDLLVKAGLVLVERQGRHRYHRISQDSVADLIEHMGTAFFRSAPELKVSPIKTDLGPARACYSHLAGRLGVLIRESMEGRGFITLEGSEYRLTPSGVEFTKSLGIEDPPRFGKACLDWTERVPHIGGPLGRRIFESLIDKEWIIRGDIPRQVLLTRAGTENFVRCFSTRNP